MGLTLDATSVHDSHTGEVPRAPHQASRVARSDCRPLSASPRSWRPPSQNRAGSYLDDHIVDVDLLVDEGYTVSHTAWKAVQAALNLTQV